MRLGGSANLLEPFPEKPRGMRRRTYHRLLARAVAAQERSIGLETDNIRRLFRPVTQEQVDATIARSVTEHLEREQPDGREHRDREARG